MRNSKEHTLALLIQIVKLQSIALVVLTLSRVLFFLLFQPEYETLPTLDLLSSFWLGLRIDLALICYVSILPVVYIFISHILALRHSKIVICLYFISIYLLFGAIVGADMAFYSYFGERTNMLIFGFFDDDTTALLNIAYKNYNIFYIVLFSIFYIIGTIYIVQLLIFKSRLEPKQLKLKQAIALFASTIVIIALGARGSIGLFPLLKDIPNISSDEFINATARNGVFEFKEALSHYNKAKSNSNNLIEQMGYGGDIKRAYKEYLDTNRTVVHMTKKEHILEQNPPHVVVVMVESFGSDILQYQSDSFDILRSLKKYFDKDIVFNNFISGANGTIVSLEPLLLNLIPRPNSISYAQSNLMGTNFKSAAARVYKNKGYETSFVYGGDLSWRNIGSFLKRQGFDGVYGKAAIKERLETEDHDWGVYDRYTYQFVYDRLKNATSPQFIFILTTNNHPPYEISSKYSSKPLLLPKKLKHNIVADIDLALKRLYDYQYALDQAGLFLDLITTDTALANKSVVAITADNNTIEGIMRHKSKKVPFYIHLPPHLKKSPPNLEVASSHKDLFATLYNLTLSEASYISLGDDLYRSYKTPCGFNDSGLLVSSDGVFKLDKAKSTNDIECAKRYRASLAITQDLINRADQ